jgi:drug/metabolite transporter (DMT)-like permease
VTRPSSGPTVSAQPFAPLALAAAAIALLSAMDGVIKHLVADHSSLIVTLGRYVFGAGFAALIWLHAGRPVLTGEIWRAHALRGAVIAVSASLFFWSLTVLPLAEVVTIAFLAPLLVPFAAWAILGERARVTSVLAGLAGFAGVGVSMIGAPPAEAGSNHALGVAAVLGAAVTYAVSVTLLRGRAGKDGAAVVGLMATLIPGAFVAGPALLSGPLPKLDAVPAFLLMGLLAAAGMWLLAKAYAGAEAQRLAPLEFTGLPWAALIGWVFFAEVPRPAVWAGAAIIVAACLAAAWLDRRGAEGAVPG